MNFKISGLHYNLFKPLFKLSDHELAEKHATRIIVDSSPGYPCRISLSDAKVGECVIATPFTHHDVNSPYHSSGPIFIRENADEYEGDINQIPEMLISRLLSVRGYNAQSFMIAADVVPGNELGDHIKAVFEDEAIDYLHIHNAKPGCFNCCVNRAS